MRRVTAALCWIALAGVVAMHCAAQAPTRAARARDHLYLAAQATLLVSAVYDAHQTSWGMAHTDGIEMGEAKWFVNRRSAAQVIVFNAAEDAGWLYLSHRLWQHGGGFWRGAAIAILLGRAVAHVEGGRSWSEIPRR